MIDAKHKEFIEERIEEAKRKWKLRDDEDLFRINALRAHVCPLCGGKLIEGSELMELLTQTARYKCLDCGAKHRRVWGG